ncbi:40S ribosomal protein S10, putative [Entamoeba dispar SAW760]|uniref:40S ribosomal protein S10, putative n=1 Tax=Entamoeba dispar (strain ATCC PRA-260 / SAW760) TaxID=370354 RepID=B0E5I8_ENTDS|nr:40S ribosomal protein S10, putative [Entamoeba dispar SAW760]XP_001740327.1 40S ribosomal protein S10, putative [Entamoeba dispar SAW760]EDR23258.1 40S ribosomal protein S10, putative [Entamoeba dispar SAW760]EDR30209.1 40S ribosomal protein S10, putative [Entamoeba dispar SAW760]|eukprot:EDR23258.1 40S ribosomal protein S10, putative [Entamoeba dispar SAW760]
MRIATKDIIAIYKQLFNDGCIVCHKDFVCLHPVFGIPNLQVFMLMKGLATKKCVKETCNWRCLYWTLNDEGIAYLRQKLALPEDAVPSTLKQTVHTAVREEAKQIQGERKLKRDFNAGKKPEMKKAE